MRAVVGLLGLVALVVGGVVVMAEPAPVWAGKPPMAAFAGTWRLEATRQHMTDGTVRPDPDLGARPSGYMMFDVATGKMCVTIANGDRAKWLNPSSPTADEAHDIYHQMVAYCAGWSVDDARSELVYTLEIDQSPNRTGTERRRRFAIERDRLVLYPTPLPFGVVDWEVEWRRMPPSAD